MLSSFLLGCGASTKVIAINDYIVGADYKITKVDGLPAKRAKHSFATVVPVVLVSEGEHHLTVRYARKVDFTHKFDAPEDLTVNVKKGSDYKIMRKDGKPSLIEDNGNNEKILELDQLIEQLN